MGGIGETMRRAGLDPDKDKGGVKYAQNTGRWGVKDGHRIEASQEQMVKEGVVEGKGEKRLTRKAKKLKQWKLQGVWGGKENKEVLRDENHIFLPIYAYFMLHMKLFYR